MRRSFSLRSKSRNLAAVEAQAIHETLLSQGWNAVDPGSVGQGTGRRGATSDPPRTKTELHYWRQRLLRRSLVVPRRSSHPGEWSVRIDHAGYGHFFPLGEMDEEIAAARAREIYFAVVREGWESVCQRHPYELTLALHWTSNPLVWTYSTLCTVTRHETKIIKPGSPGTGSRLKVIVIEPDPNIRRALSICVGRLDGFACVAACATADVALETRTGQSVHIVLANQILPGPAEEALADRLKRIAPAALLLPYSTYEDSDQLFKATPGGASGYFLRRTAPNRLFEPIGDLVTTRPFTAADVTIRVRRYFQNVLLALSSQNSQRETAKLTDREHEIMNLLSRGCVDKEIADALQISIWTVHGHLKRIYEKLGVHTRTEAAIKFLDK